MKDAATKPAHEAPDAMEQFYEDLKRVHGRALWQTEIGHLLDKFHRVGGPGSSDDAAFGSVLHRAVGNVRRDRIIE